MKTIIHAFLFGGLFSCQNMQGQGNNKGILLDSSGTNSFNTESEQHEIIDFPNDANLPALLITREVESDSGATIQKKWLGLFTNSGKTYLKKTKIKLIPFYDRIYEGYEVVASENNDKLIILISGLDFLTEHPIENILPKLIQKSTAKKPHELSLDVDDSLLYSYKGVEYLMRVSGSIQKESGYIVNYKTFLQATINGKVIEELLFSRSSSADMTGSIIFIGDIDGDDIPDLILDTCVGGYQSNSTLYLSKPADKGHLLKVVGSDTYGGC